MDGFTPTALSVTDGVSPGIWRWRGVLQTGNRILGQLYLYHLGLLSTMKSNVLLTGV